MKKSSKAPAPPPSPLKGELTVIDGELAIVSSDGASYALDAIARSGDGSEDAELTVVVNLSKRTLRASVARTELLGVVDSLEVFLRERALGTLEASATCGNVPPRPPAKKTVRPTQPPKAPKPSKPSKSSKSSKSSKTKG